MEIILHAGMHKTGTTAFQNYLRKAAADLEKEGTRVFVPGPFTILPNSSLFDAAWVRRQVARAQSDGIEKLIFSHEEISQFSEPQLHSLVSLMSPHAVTYVAAFRHWCSYLPSRWAQNCSRRDSQSFPRFMDRLDTQTPSQTWYRFDQVLKNAQSAGCETIKIVSYDDAKADIGVVASLARACGIPVQAADRTLWSRANVSLTRPAPDRIRLFNALRAKCGHKIPNALQQRLESGRPGGALFDQQKVVTALLETRPDMKEAIDRQIDASLQEVELLPDRFERLNDLFKTAAQASRIHPPEGAFFEDIKPHREEYAMLELDDLSSELRQEMNKALVWELRKNRIQSNPIVRRSRAASSRIKALSARMTDAISS